MANPAKVRTASGTWVDLAVQSPDISNYSTTTQMNTAIDNAKGLVLVNSTNFSSATTIQINNIFSSTYDFYKIVYRIDTLANDTVRIKMSSGGTPTSGGTDYRWSRIYWYSTISPANNGGNTGTSDAVFCYLGTVGNNDGFWEIQNPFLTKATVAQGQAYYGGVGELAFFTNTSSTSFDGITLTCSSSLTGNIKVYGYRNS